MKKIKVGISVGDPAGIGPIIAGKAIEQLRGEAEFVVIGPLGQDNNFTPGGLSAQSGRASIEYLDRALELIKSKEIDCLVTCPISKEAIFLAGFPYSGHTEYFSQRAKTDDPVMMLLNKNLKLSLVTRHIPIAEVPLQLSGGKITKTITITVEALKTLFSIQKPRIVVCGLNPHASDNGVIGKEENQMIRPALEELRQETHAFIEGPISADVAIYKTLNKEFDAAIAMFHDQALIPLKLLGNDSGVNITLGLPFIRTSPLHGTAFDIAKTPKLANPKSLIAAIKLAIKCVYNLKKA